jgi:small subunit ribosomal protein S8
MGASDPISDGLTKISNASRAGHPTVEVRASKFLAAILDVFKREGFIRAWKIMGETPAQRMFRVYLKYANKRPAITRLVRISTPGMRTYRKARKLPRVLGGLGVAVVSTSSGLMTEREAYHKRIGGEVICYVW